MYTKEQLKSDAFIKLYKQIGNDSLTNFMEAEQLLNQRINKERNSININQDNMSFSFSDEKISYNEKKPLNNDGTYLKTDIVMDRERFVLDINLELGIEGFDVATGERFERKQARVKYFYGNNIFGIDKIEDEEELNNIEQKNQENNKAIILEQKR